MASVLSSGQAPAARYAAQKVDVAQFVNRTAFADPKYWDVAYDLRKVFLFDGSVSQKSTLFIEDRPTEVPSSRKLFFLAVGFFVFSCVLTGFALIADSWMISSVSAFALIGAFSGALAWLECIQRERQ